MKNIKSAIIVVVALCICCVIMGIGSSAYKTNFYAYEETTTYCVAQGDTLWTIAKHYSSEAQDVRKTVDIIQDINDCGAMIYPGQKLEIPVYKNMGGK